MRQNENLLTVPQVAKHLQVSEWTVREWLRKGDLLGVRLGGTRIGWRVSELELRDFIVRRVFTDAVRLVSGEAGRQALLNAPIGDDDTDGLSVDVKRDLAPFFRHLKAYGLLKLVYPRDLQDLNMSALVFENDWQMTIVQELLAPEI